MSANVDECVTVRLAPGVKEQIRAASGMPVSKFFRMMASAYLATRREQRKPTATEEVMTAAQNINLESPQ